MERFEASGPERIVELGYEGLLRCPACETVIRVNLWHLSGEDVGHCPACSATLSIDDRVVIALSRS